MKKNEQSEGSEQHIGSLLSLFLRKFPLQDGLQKVQVEEAWAQIMGSPIARHTRRVTFRDGTVYVELDSDPLRHELQYGISQILRSFQEHFGEELVKEVRLV